MINSSRLPKEEYTFPTTRPTPGRSLAVLPELSILMALISLEKIGWIPDDIICVDTELELQDT